MKQLGPKVVLHHPNCETFQIWKLGPSEHMILQKDVFKLENFTLEIYDTPFYNAELIFYQIYLSSSTSRSKGSIEVSGVDCLKYSESYQRSLTFDQKHQT